MVIDVAGVPSRGHRCKVPYLEVLNVAYEHLKSAARVFRTHVSPVPDRLDHKGLERNAWCVHALFLSAHSSTHGSLIRMEPLTRLQLAPNSLEMKSMQLK